jgi:hypothetical protein
MQEGELTMEKRPTSLTVIAWLLIILSVLALLSLIVMTAMSSNPQVSQKIAEMHLSATAEAVSVVGAVIDLICAYGILKGQPWSRVLYVACGVIGTVSNLYTSPQKLGAVIGLVVLVIFSIFLFGEKANVWFQARGFMLRRETMPG